MTGVKPEIIIQSAAGSISARCSLHHSIRCLITPRLRPWTQRSSYHPDTLISLYWAWNFPNTKMLSGYLIQFSNPKWCKYGFKNDMLQFRIFCFQSKKLFCSLSQSNTKNYPKEKVEAWRYKSLSLISSSEEIHPSHGSRTQHNTVHTRLPDLKDPVTCSQRTAL